MQAGAMRWRFLLRTLLTLVMVTGACAAGRPRKRKRLPEGEVDFVIGATCDTVRFDYSIIGESVTKQSSKKAESQRVTKRKKLQDYENLDFLRERQLNKKHKSISTRVILSTASELREPYLNEIEETKRVTLRTTRKAKFHEYSDLMTPLHAMNVDQDTTAASLYIPNFYPVTQPKKRDDTTRRTKRATRTKTRRAKRP